MKKKDNPNDALENQMDLFNNALGRTIGSRSYSGNSSQVSYAIRQAVLKAVKMEKQEDLLVLI